MKKNPKSSKAEAKTNPKAKTKTPKPVNRKVKKKVSGMRRRNELISQDAGSVNSSIPLNLNPAFRFIDLFAGIGGIRGVQGPGVQDVAAIVPADGMDVAIPDRMAQRLGNADHHK